MMKSEIVFCILYYLLEFERNKIKEQLTSGLPANGSASEVELSEESDSSVTEARKPKINSKQGWYN